MGGEAASQQDYAPKVTARVNYLGLLPASDWRTGRLRLRLPQPRPMSPTVPGSLSRRPAARWAAGRTTPVLQGGWFNDGFRVTIWKLLAAIADGRELRDWSRGSLRRLALCFAVVASARERREVGVGEINDAQGYRA